MHFDISATVCTSHSLACSAERHQPDESRPHCWPRAAMEGRTPPNSTSPSPSSLPLHRKPTTSSANTGESVVEKGTNQGEACRHQLPIRGKVVRQVVSFSTVSSLRRALLQETPQPPLLRLQRFCLSPFPMPLGWRLPCLCLYSQGFPWRSNLLLLTIIVLTGSFHRNVYSDIILSKNY